MPAEVAALANDLSLHDARFKTVAVDYDSGNLKLRLRCGDLQHGYFDLSLDYEGAEMIDATPRGISALMGPPTAEVLYDEIDVTDDGRFEHDMRLWPDGELVVRFSNLTLARDDVPSRDAP